MQTRNVYLLQSSGPGNVVIRDGLDRVFRQKRLILLLAGFWTAGMAAYLVFSPRVYEGDIQFLINNNRAGTVLSAEYNNGPVARDYVDESVIATEIQLLSNADLLRSVVERCGLAEATGDAEVEKAVKKLQKKLKVSPVLKANMIKASYSSSDPREVEAVLRALSDGYLEEHLRAHGTKGAYDLFDKQAAFYQRQLVDLQNRLAQFQEQHSIVVLGQQKDLNLRKLVDLEAAYSDNEAARVANTQKISRLRDQLTKLKPRITTQARRLPNQYSVERLNTMLVEFQNKRTDLLAKFQPTDRLVQEVDKQIADTKAALDRADVLSATEETTDVNPLRQTLEADLAKADLNDTEYRARTTSLENEVARYRKSLSSLQNATTADEQLLRDIKETEDSFFLYSKKREEARIEEAMDRSKIANVALVKPARFPALPQDRVSVTVIATYALGCLLILGFAFAAGIARPAVFTPWELEGLTGLPVLASVPNQLVGGKPARALLSESIPEFTL